MTILKIQRTLLLKQNHKFSNTNDTMYIDNKLCGYAMPLSIANILKSSTYDEVDTIIFDEFILDDSGTYHYIKNDKFRKKILKKIKSSDAAPMPNQKTFFIFLISQA